MDYILIERAIFNAIVARITEYSAKIELAMGNLGCHPLGNWVDNERAQRLLQRGKRSLQSLRSSDKIGYTIIDGKVMYPLKEIDRFISKSYMQCVEHFAAQRIANLRVQKPEDAPFLPSENRFFRPSRACVFVPAKLAVLTKMCKRRIRGHYRFV